MKIASVRIASFCFLLLLAASLKAASVHHYAFFNQDHEQITNHSFLDTKALEGAQLKYVWKRLEPEKDKYDFSEIRHDLEFLKANGKRLFIQLQDTSFDTNNILVPGYLLKDPAYHGGADKQYDIKDDDEAHAVEAGWVGRRWDAAVQERFHKLLFALGKEFDGKIEGINLPETAIDFGQTGKLFPKGFTPAVYRDATLTNMIELKRAFAKSITMQYANFMPGEWLPEDNKGYLRSVYEFARQNKIGVGGPDLLPFQRGQLNHAYPLIKECAGTIPTGIAVQDGNYAHKNPKTGEQVTIPTLVQFATETLKVNYIFWCHEEPYYSQKLLPFLNNR